MNGIVAGKTGAVKNEPKNIAFSAIAENATKADEINKKAAP